MTRIQGIDLLSMYNRLRHHRFLKFGTVGAFGVLINIAVLYLGREFVFKQVPWPNVSLNLSLAFAILCATTSNFICNRHWTWRDRQQHGPDKRLIVQFGQYALACWVGVVLQIVLTNLLTIYVYYLAANLIAIIIASTFNYLANDLWTFRQKKRVGLIRTNLL